MIDIEYYIPRLIDLLKCQFGSRLLYVGLQGSYLRGEASANSDLDIMVVIDKLCVADLGKYREIIYTLEHSDKSCGFICSKDDLMHWNPLEIHHLLHTTKDYFGILRDLIPMYTEQDIRNFIKLSTNNLYHIICHRYIHSEDNNNIANLATDYKGVFFILQNIYYLTHGTFISTKAELLSKLNGIDYQVLKRAIDLNSGLTYNFHESFELLFTWCQAVLQRI